MKFTQYADVKAFYQDTYDVLMRNEVQNLIPLGNVIIGNEGKDKEGWRDPARWFMATVSDGAGIRLTAIMTPPHNLTLYATDNQYDGEALSALVNGILENGCAVSGVMTESALAEDFARAYAHAKGLSARIHQRLRLYELTRVNPDIPAIGSLRLAREGDMAFLPYWCAGFERDCFGSASSIESLAEYARYSIASGKHYILEDHGTPVSMARIPREMRTVCGIGYVYTPPYYRGRGYASSCVAATSRVGLGRGFSKCALYTDLSNPTSNSIYQKIGYRALCDSLEIAFE